LFAVMIAIILRFSYLLFGDMIAIILRFLHLLFVGTGGSTPTSFY
jgi:hypothetical protein